jgi:hypothetical protein
MFSSLAEELAEVAGRMASAVVAVAAAAKSSIGLDFPSWRALTRLRLVPEVQEEMLLILHPMAGCPPSSRFRHWEVARRRTATPAVRVAMGMSAVPAQLRADMAAVAVLVAAGRMLMAKWEVAAAMALNAP